MFTVNNTTFSNETSSSNTIFAVSDKIPKTVAYCHLFLISIVGNSLIVWIIYKDKRLRTTTNYLVSNMAVSDLVSILFLVPFNIVQINFDNRWLITNDFGNALCKLVPFIIDTSSAVSLCSCVFIALDRYYAVAHPLKGGFTRSRLKYIIPGIWIFSGLLLSPHLNYSQLVDHGMAYCIVKDRSLHRIHVFLLAVLNVGISLPIISTLYILIVYKLRHHRVPGNQTDFTRRVREQQNRKILKMSVTIVSLLYLSWLFYGIVIIVLKFQGYLNHLTNLVFAATFILRMSFAYNFFIYVIFNDIYRDNVKAIITQWCCQFCQCGNRRRNARVAGTVGQEMDQI